MERTLGSLIGDLAATLPGRERKRAALLVLPRVMVRTGLPGIATATQAGRRGAGALETVRGVGHRLEPLA